MTQREQVLRMLQRAGEDGVSTAAFLEARLPRFSARIQELRREGHTIESIRVREGSWRYLLSGAESVPAAFEGSAPSPEPQETTLSAYDPEAEWL